MFVLLWCFFLLQASPLHSLQHNSNTASVDVITIALLWVCSIDDLHEGTVSKTCWFIQWMRLSICIVLMFSFFYINMHSFNSFIVGVVVRSLCIHVHLWLPSETWWWINQHSIGDRRQGVRASLWFKLHVGGEGEGGGGGGWLRRCGVSRPAVLQCIMIYNSLLIFCWIRSHHQTVFSKGNILKPWKDCDIIISWFIQRKLN